MSNSFNIEDDHELPHQQFESGNGFQWSANTFTGYRTDRNTTGHTIPVSLHRGQYYPNTPHAPPPCCTHQVARSPNPQGVPSGLGHNHSTFNQYNRRGSPGYVTSTQVQLGGMDIPVVDDYGRASSLVPSQSFPPPHPVHYYSHVYHQSFPPPHPVHYYSHVYHQSFPPPHPVHYSSHVYPEMQLGQYPQHPFLQPQPPRQTLHPLAPPHAYAPQTTMYPTSTCQTVQNTLMPHGHRSLAVSKAPYYEPPQNVAPAISVVPSEPPASRVSYEAAVPVYSSSIIITSTSSLDSDPCPPQSACSEEVQSHTTSSFSNLPSQPSLLSPTTGPLSKRIRLANQSDSEEYDYTSAPNSSDSNISTHFRPWLDNQHTESQVSRGTINVTSSHGTVVSSAITTMPNNVMSSSHPFMISSCTPQQMSPAVGARSVSHSQLSLPAISKEKFDVVYSTLYSVRSKWYEFGLALELLPDTLNSIENDGRGKTESCLRLMLHERMKMKHLSWDEVMVALRRPSVNRNDLAEKIEKGDLYYLNKAGAVKDLSGEPTLEELCSLPVEKVWYQLGVWLGVEDIISSQQKYNWPSNKLKWIFTAFLNLPIGTKQYEELVKKLSKELQQQAKELLEESRVNDFIKLFPSSKQTAAEELAKKKQDHKYSILITALVKVGQRKVAEEVCSKKDVSLYHYLEETDPASNPPDCVTEYAKFLKYKYKQMSVLPDPDWPPALSTKDHYTNLAIIERERDSYTGDDEVKARDYAHGRIDKIVGEKKPISLEETFYPIINSEKDSRLTILMDGAPGVGKTTITRKLCIDWANGHILQEYYLVVLIPLREFKLSQQDVFRVSDLLIGDDVTLKDDVLQYLQKYSGSNSLLIFDGFDELSYKERELIGNSLLVKIIKGDILFRSSIIVTSRPYASKSLKDFQRVNRHVEVLGFTERQISDCVEQNLKENGEKLLQDLNERLDIKSLCYIPLNCRIVLFVYKRNNNELPDTLTQLYEIFILHTIKHFANRISTDPYFLKEIKDAPCYDAFPVSVKRQLNLLSEMAFLGMEEDKLVFTRNELKELDLLSLGLLTSLFVLATVTEIEHFQFMHLTIQEFLAAKYLSSKLVSNDKIKEFFRKNIGSDRFRMTLLFLAGLTKFNFLTPKETILKEDDISLNEFLDSKSSIIFLLQLLYESRNESTRVLPLLKAKLDMSGYTLSQFDVCVLSHAFSYTPPGNVWEEVSLQNCGLSNECLSTFLSLKVLYHPSWCALGMVKKLDLRSRLRKLFNLHFINNFLAQAPSLVSVNFDILETDPDCSLVSKLCEVLADHPTLQTISFGNQRTLSRKRLLQNHSNCFPICSYAFVHLVKFLDSEQITEFHLIGYSQTFKDCVQCGGSGVLARKCLSELISKSQKLKSLNLRECHLTDEFMLKHKGLKCAKVSGNSGICLTDSVQTWALDKKSTSIKFDEIHLKKNKESQVEIKMHNSENETVDILSRVLKAFEESALTLHKFTVYVLTNDLAKLVCQMLQNFKTLYTLEISGFGVEEGLLQIFCVLQRNSTLRELKAYCCRDDQTAKALFEMIERNKTINTLTISPRLFNREWETMARVLLKNTTLKNLYLTDDVDPLKEAIRQLKENKHVQLDPNWNLKIIEKEE